MARSVRQPFAAAAGRPIRGPAGPSTAAAGRPIRGPAGPSLPAGGRPIGVLAGAGHPDAGSTSSAGPCVRADVPSGSLSEPALA